MNSKIAAAVTLLAVMVAVAVADTRPYGGRGDDMDSDEFFEPPKYEFAWGVKDDNSGNMFNQMESRDDDSTKGAYYVALPDGRIQKVTYYVDGDSGFVAEVSYEGEASFPDESREASYRPQYN